MPIGRFKDFLIRSNNLNKYADIFVLDSCVGYVGVLGPDMVEKLDLKKQKPEIVVFELNLDLLLTFIPDVMQYTDIPKYPPVERDIAVVVDETIPSSRIQEIIRAYPSQFIEDVSVFDYFKGGNIPEGKKSIAFNIIYRSKDRTLRDEEVEELHISLVDHIIEKTGGEAENVILNLDKKEQLQLFFIKEPRYEIGYSSKNISCAMKADTGKVKDSWHFCFEAV